MTENTYSVVIFDWDGTLMDSEARIVSCLRSAIADLGLAERDRQDLSNIIGLGLREAIETLYPGLPDPDQHQLTDRYRHYFLHADDTPMPLFDGARETVQTLAEQGYLLAVATGKARRGLNRALEQTGMAELFHGSRCADECFSKPHPAMLEEILDQFGASPIEAVMIGDTEYDMQMATNAGVDAIAVSYGVHSLERLNRHGPVASIDHIRELPSVIAAGRGPGG